ncbi:MAG: hypothetical protein ACE5IZ_08190 [Dehalococcoidia bacterium]
MHTSKRILATWGMAAAAIALLLGLWASSGPTSTAQAQEEVTLTLAEVDGSGVGGTVTLSPDGDNVQVTVNATGLTDGESYFSAPYDDTSVTCRGGLIGSFAAPQAASGDSMTIAYTAPGPIDDIFSISVRQGTSPPGTVVACAERPAAQPTPTPAAAPNTGIGPQTRDSSGIAASWYALMAAVGALLLTGGATLVSLRRR